MSSGNDGDNDEKAGTKFFELEEDTFEDDGENVVGTKFFGGSAEKDELFVAEEEEMAVELQRMSSLTAVLDRVDTATEEAAAPMEYDRFEDNRAFEDDLSRSVGRALQEAVRGVLDDQDKGSDGASVKIAYDASLAWTTPLDSKSTDTSSQKNPLTELAASRSFYTQLDAAIISGRTVSSSGDTKVVELRWDIGALWPNPWQSRVLVTGTSLLTVRESGDGSSISISKQTDRLDGNDSQDVVGLLSPQLSPRFWDVWHIGMTPSAEIDPRFAPFSVPASASTSAITKEKQPKKGLFSKYQLHHLPPRLTVKPSMVDVNGRSGRAAQSLPNHAFTTAIKTMGPNKQNFTPVSPIEVSLSKAKATTTESLVVKTDDENGAKKEKSASLITWSVPVPPEFACNSVLPLPLIEPDSDDDDVNDKPAEKKPYKSLKGVPDDVDATTSPYTTVRQQLQRAPPPITPRSPTCSYELRPHRLVATLPYAGSPQDEKVSEIRKELYQQVVENDGLKPKLDPETGRPVFFFWMNDSKACFTKDGGLGMAVYESRPEWAESNEVGIELEFTP